MHRSPSAATFSAGRSTSRRRSGCSTRFVDAGFNLIDTADSYSRWVPGHTGGESETIIGRWIAQRGRHDDVVIATKVGSDMGLGYKCLRREYIVQGVEQSLKRLQVDAIDLYQSHWDDDKTPFDETLEAYSRLMQQGKVKAIGASNLTRASAWARRWRASKERALPRYATLQPQYNLYDRDSFEGALQDLCVREGLGVITYFSLAAGFLTGKYRSEADFAKSQRGRGMQKYLNPRGLRILAALDAGCDSASRPSRRRWRSRGSSAGRASPRPSPAPRRSRSSGS